MFFHRRPFVAALVFLASASLTGEGALGQAPAQNATPAQSPSAGNAPGPAPPPPAQPNAVKEEQRPSPPSSATAPTETPAVVIDGGAAVALLGMAVKSSKNEDLGRVVDVIVDRNGMMRAAIVDFGGFLGVGTRKIAVDWRAIHFPDKGALDKLFADLPRDHLKMAPVYKEGEPIVVIGAPPPAPPPEAQKSPEKPQDAPKAQEAPKP
jgi:hypothetical protein